MLGFIYSNQTILTIIGVFLILIGMYFAFKKLPTKVNKKESENKEKKKEEVVAKSETEESVDKTDESDIDKLTIP